MPFGNFGPVEMIFVGVVLLLIFGAKRLPELGSGLGKGIREFKRSMKDLGGEIERSASEEREIRAPQRPPAVPSSTESSRDQETGN